MKLKLAIVTALTMSMGSLFAAESSIDMKVLGAGYVPEYEKTAYDMGLSYNMGIDRYFAIGLEPGFQWINYKEGTGQNITVGGFTSEQKIERNAFVFPMLVNFRVRFPMGGEWGGKPKFVPYFTVGAGWSYLDGTAKTPQSDGTTNEENFYANGFTYQATVGMAYNLGSAMEGTSSDLAIVAELGYRGADLEVNNSNGYKFDASSGFVRIGIRYALGGGSDF